MKKKILVFAPSYNEKIIIKKFIKEFFNYNKIDLLIIDDNSPDGTANIIKSEKIKNKFIKLIVRKKKKMELILLILMPTNMQLKKIMII